MNTIRTQSEHASRNDPAGNDAGKRRGKLKKADRGTHFSINQRRKYYIFHGMVLLLSQSEKVKALVIENDWEYVYFSLMRGVFLTECMSCLFWYGIKVIHWPKRPTVRKTVVSRIVETRKHVQSGRGSVTRFYLQGRFCAF